MHWLKQLLSRRSLYNDLSEEIQEHLAEKIEELIAAGVPRVAAERQARREFGNISLLEERGREAWQWPKMEALLADLKYALRRLAKSPLFTLGTIGVLALGIGSLTTTFTWLKAVLYDPWPHVLAPQEVRFFDATVHGGQGYSLRYNEYQYIKEHAKSYSEVVAFDLGMLDLAGKEARPEVITAGFVSSNYFHFLRLTPRLGSFFNPNADDRAYGAHDEVVLSSSLWRARFQSDPDIVGKTILLNHRPFTVIGVAPQDFSGIYGGLAEAAWVPFSAVKDLNSSYGADPLAAGDVHLMAAARILPGVKDSAAASELHGLARTYVQANLGRFNGWDLNLRDLAHFERGLLSMVGVYLPLLLGAGVLLLLLVCVNTAALLTQKTSQRQHEVSIRMALGAKKSRIISQVMIETFLLAFCGGLIGWMLSLGLSKTIYSLLPKFGIPVSFNLHSNVRIFGFVCLIIVAVTLLCGLLPARQILSVVGGKSLHRGGNSVVAGRSRGRTILLSAQMSICFVVLVCCGLLVHTVLNVSHRSIGFDPSNAVVGTIDLSRAGYDEAKGRIFQRELLNELQALPEVKSATITSHLPMGDWGSGNTQVVSVPGYTPAHGEDMNIVTDVEGPGFFKTVGIALLQGREFGDGDTATSLPVALVNEAMVHRFWPRGNALGSQVIVGKTAYQVVGIVGKYIYHDPTNVDADPLLFLPATQSYLSMIQVAVRSKTTAEAVMPYLQQTVARLDGQLPISNLQSMRESIQAGYTFVKMPAEFLSAYAVSSLLVAIVGLYAAMAAAVAERNREFALRMALGASRKRVMTVIFRAGVYTTVAGVVFGAIASFFAVKVLKSLLFGVSSFDPGSVVIAVLVMIGTALLATAVPALRAASIEPMKVLREE